jgi:hypothetical protein
MPDHDALDLEELDPTEKETLVMKLLALEAGVPPPLARADGWLFLHGLADRHGRLTEPGQDAARRLRATGAYTHVETPTVPRRAPSPPAPAPAGRGSPGTRGGRLAGYDPADNRLAYRAARGEPVF